MRTAPERGFVFYTNFEGTKGRELLAHPKAALVFHWKSLERQVRVRGPVTTVTDAEADAYYASRPPLSRIGAWASKQSRPLEGRFARKRRSRAMRRNMLSVQFPEGCRSGFRVTPLEYRVLDEPPLPLA